MSLHNPLFFQGVTPEQAEAAFPEIYEGKEKIVAAINEMEGEADVSDSYDTLANAIKSLVTPTIEVTPIQNYPSSFHDLFQVMADNYDASYPYMYAILLTRDTTSAVLALLNDGTTRAFGGESDSGKVTRWAVFRSATAGGFSFVYNGTFSYYLIGSACYNANMQGISFNGSKINFFYYNRDYNLSNIVYPVSQFEGCNLGMFTIPKSDVITITNNNLFYGSKITVFTIEDGITSLTIHGANMFGSCPNIFAIIFPDSITFLNLNNAGFVNYSSSLSTFKLPSNVETLYLNSTYMVSNNASLKQFVIPDSVKVLYIAQYTFQSASALAYLYIPMPVTSLYWNSSALGSNYALVKIELGTDFNYTIDFRAATSLTRANIVDFIFTKLKDNVGQTAKTITLASRYNTTGADPLTPAQKDVALVKNWVIAFA